MAIQVPAYIRGASEADSAFGGEAKAPPLCHPAPAASDQSFVGL
ncbi:hypothetical protein [Streptomyces sp. NBC_01481]|nr:hypothetical protein [Streptomyces sp. NBC_01481]MCX4582480.1 hypothetical protein [Streptomyces sp. NBC_01481]